MRRTAKQVVLLMDVWGRDVPEHVLFNFLTDRVEFDRDIFNEELSRLRVEGLRVEAVEYVRAVKTK